MRERFDRWYAEGMRHPSTFRHQNKVIWIDDREQGKFVRDAVARVVKRRVGCGTHPRSSKSSSP